MPPSLARGHSVAKWAAAEAGFDLAITEKAAYAIGVDEIPLSHGLIALALPPQGSPPAPAKRVAVSPRAQKKHK